MADTKIRLANVDAFNNSLMAILRNSNKPVQDTMRKQARLIVEKLFDVTPPAGKHAKGKAAQKVGIKTVKSQISKVLIGAPVSSNRKSLSGITTKDIARQHEKYRKGGRIARKLVKKDRLVVPTNKLKQYQKSRSKAVGMLMAGWNKPAAKLGVRRGWGQWVKAHNPPSLFTFKANSRRIYIKFSNKVKYAGAVGVMAKRLDYALHRQARSNEKIIANYTRAARDQGFKIS